MNIFLGCGQGMITDFHFHLKNRSKYCGKILQRSMENEDKGQTSPRSIDSNMEGEIQPSIETKLELIPVEAEQVSSLTTNHVPMGEVINLKIKYTYHHLMKLSSSNTKGSLLSNNQIYLNLGSYNNPPQVQCFQFVI